MKLNLLAIVAIFSTGFLLGFAVGDYNSKSNFYGESVLLEQVHQDIKKEEIKIDILEEKNKVIEVKKARIQNKREVIKKNYEKDTIYINSLEFDSLAILFLRLYPR
jgi:hypothetical protein